jgi:hypothetical protein
MTDPRKPTAAERAEAIATFRRWSQEDRDLEREGSRSDAGDRPVEGPLRLVADSHLFDNEAS